MPRVNVGKGIGNEGVRRFCEKGSPQPALIALYEARHVVDGSLLVAIGEVTLTLSDRISPF